MFQANSINCDTADVSEANLKPAEILQDRINELNEEIKIGSFYHHLKKLKKECLENLSAALSKIEQDTSTFPPLFKPVCLYLKVSLSLLNAQQTHIFEGRTKKAVRTCQHLLYEEINIQLQTYHSQPFADLLQEILQILKERHAPLKLQQHWANIIYLLTHLTLSYSSTVTDTEIANLTPINQKLNQRCEKLYLHARTIVFDDIDFANEILKVASIYERCKEKVNQLNPRKGTPEKEEFQGSTATAFGEIEMVSYPLHKERSLPAANA